MNALVDNALYDLGLLASPVYLVPNLLLTVLWSHGYSFSSSKDKLFPHLKATTLMAFSALDTLQLLNPNPLLLLNSYSLR